MKKFEFTGETKIVNGIALHRIRACIRLCYSDGSSFVEV